MDLKGQRIFIEKMYSEIFQNVEIEKIPNFFSKDFFEENNYEKLNYDEFLIHVEKLKNSEKVKFEIEFLVNEPFKVVVRVFVYSTSQILKSAPISLLISYWHFNTYGLIDFCKEVECSK